MAKQKPVQGKKGSKNKPARPAAKEVKSGRKPSAGPKAATAGPSARKRSPSPEQKQTPAKKLPDKKTAALKAVAPAKAAKAAKPAEKPDKTAERGIVTKQVLTKPVSAKIVRGKAAAQPAGKNEEAVKAGKTPTRGASAAALKPKQLAVKPAAPRIVSNGQVAGVLQAARSVASRANKVVEVEKARKSHLTAEELAEFRQILLDKRRELVDDMVNLEDEARRTGAEGGSASSAMPIHMADLGSDTWEQEFTLNLIEKERMIVREIDEALDRIEKKTFGTCLATGKAISKARLRVKPWAKYCIEYARKRELGLT